MRTITIDGVLLVDKPAGVTSHDVVARARRVLDIRRIGHAGTLDPFATGLLVLLVGRATRLLPYVDGEPKVYDATIAFGAETTTDDLTGDITRVAALPASSDVDRAIESLTGRFPQLPPDYSAKQVEGRRAYAAARAGSPIALEPVPVVVNEWRVRHRDAATLDVTITCGAGTYVRALARDLGRGAGSAAHLISLRRTRSGPFDLSMAASMTELEKNGPERLAPSRSAIPHIPPQHLSDDEQQRVRHGHAVEARIGATIAALVSADDKLIAIARREDGLFQPRVVLQND